MAPLLDAHGDQSSLLAGNRPENTTRFSPYRLLENDQIRLASTSTGSGDQSHDGVFCTLTHVFRHSPGVYKALSYAWGDPLEVGVITVDGHPLVVRRTLEVALRVLQDRHLRSGHREPLLVWVDALCINQADARERGEQVGRMRLIYEYAEEVIVWLGTEDEDSALAFELMHQLHDETLDISTVIHHSHRAKFDALKNLFRRPYWWRIWVIQEVASARQAAIPITMYCGTDYISWSRLRQICGILNEDRAREQLKNSIYFDSPADVFSVTRGGPEALEPSLFPLANHRSNSPALLDFLTSHMSKLSTDPRDKIYGLVGYSSSRKTFGKIDYTLSVRSLYVRTTQFIISTTKSLNVICLQQNDDNPFELPSWVADWERRLSYPKHRVVGLHIRSPPFRASRESHPKVHFAQNGDEMTAAGFLIDTVKAAGHPLYLEGHEREIMPTFTVFHNWWNIFVKARENADQEKDVFERAFCGGAWRPSYEEYDSEKQKLRRLELFFGLLQRPLLEVLDHGTGTTTIPVKDDELLKRQKEMISQASLRMHGKRLVITEHNLIGLAPLTAEIGDTIAVLLGCAFPVVLRNMQEYYAFVGEVYVDSIMDGEAMDNLKSSFYTETDFKIR